MRTGARRGPRRRLVGAAVVAAWPLAVAFAAGCIADAQEDPCVRGSERCGERCVDLDHDPLHCGACGARCAPGFRCDEGACRCDLPFTQCPSGCFDLSRDPDHCGRCDVACATGIGCEEGACGGDCATGLIRCEGRCVDPRVDTDHCGGCGQACPAGQTCSESEGGTGACTCGSDGGWPCPVDAVAVRASGDGAAVAIADLVAMTTADGDALVVAAGVFGGASVDFGGQVAATVGDADVFVAAYDASDLSLRWLFTLGAAGRTQQATDLEVTPTGRLVLVANLRAAGTSPVVVPPGLPFPAALRTNVQGVVFELDPRLFASERVSAIGLAQGSGGNQWLDAVVERQGELFVVGHQQGNSGFLSGCVTSESHNTFVGSIALGTDTFTCHGLLGAKNDANDAINPNGLDLEVDADGALHVIGSAVRPEVRATDGVDPPRLLQLQPDGSASVGFDVTFRAAGAGAFAYDGALVVGDANGSRSARLLAGARRDDGTLAVAGWVSGTAVIAAVPEDGSPASPCDATLVTGSQIQAFAMGRPSGATCPSWVWSAGGVGNDPTHTIAAWDGGFLVLGEYDQRIAAGNFEAERVAPPGADRAGYFLASFAPSGTAEWLLGDLEGGASGSLLRQAGIAVRLDPSADDDDDGVEIFWAGEQGAAGDGAALPPWSSDGAQAFVGRFRLGR
ncbi:MAG: MXAN_6577-like cysteine-rich protein [Myxococcota bacterium]